MSDNISISVIVPIYGVEQFIERCARSLFEQTIKNGIEYIFVDDCTKDNSIKVLNKVLDEYPERKFQVTLLRHEVNKGLPQARKTGVMVARGEYIAHCDSDDWVCCNMYEKMYNHAKSNNYDLVYCDYYLSDGKSEKYVRKKTNARLLQGPVWNKIVKREIYTRNSIIYPTANKAEDGALMTQLSFFSSKIGYLCEPLYFYFNNPLSMSRIASEEECVKRLRQEIDNTTIRLEFLNQQGSIDSFPASVIIWKLSARNNILPLIGKKDYYKMWINTYPEINKQVFVNSEISFRVKVAFLLQMLRLYNLKKKLLG